jgi:DNA replication and repair protein RecF
MRLSHLSLTNFRNYSRLELDIPSGEVVLLGDNAQGKTNLLEAIYYLATSRSPYTTTDRQLINWLADDEHLPYARLVAELITSREIKRLEITLVKEPNSDGQIRLRKEIRVNGLTRRTLDLLGTVIVVMFTPQDMALVEGSPTVRRRYLNVTLCQVEPGYCRALSQFDKVLAQRNALLRTLRETRRSGSDDELAFWDRQLTQNGAIVIAARNRLVRDLEHLAQPIHEELTGGLEHLRLKYHPSFDPAADPGGGQMAFSPADLGAAALPDMHPDRIAERYLAALKVRRREEIARGQTLIGPQRDELRFLVNGKDLGHYGSRGQNRTAILALKLAEVAWMRRQSNEWPILLLDEVAAELDETRRAYLLDRINGAEQVVLTTTEPGLLTKEFLARAAMWRVEEGRITKDA